MAQNGTSQPQPSQFPMPNSLMGNISSLHDRVALITGGSSGLGRAIAQAYASAGAYIISADLSPTPPAAPTISAKTNEDFTTPTIDLINKHFPSTKTGVDRASYIHCDVTDEQSVKSAVQFAVQKYGRLDIIVNNAGISAESSSPRYNGTFTRIHETDVSILDRTLAVNVRGVWLGTKHAVAQFLAQEPHPVFGRSGSDVHRGWVINLASILGSVGLPGASSYVTSKGAVMQLTKATALEYAKDGIHVNALQPGFTDTHMLEAMYARSENTGQTLSALHPWGRTGRAEDIARAAVFLAGEGAGWITGTSIVVDGGYLAQ
ncbi:hypothetical protein PV11_08376 [Exophiala sideris]|uniref:Uncharacterized protein n=1 Tax=Exophiala sideris TaxID=1016849 RepID=A0A0D1VX91_9EURO|nr:hypothetical protein PV11_08376 [Exophiala sideris]